MHSGEHKTRSQAVASIADRILSHAYSKLSSNYNDRC